MSAWLVALPLAAEAPPDPEPPDWRTIESLIDESRYDEALQQAREIDRSLLDAGGNEKSAEVLGRIADLAGEAEQNRLAVSALIALALSETELARYRASNATLEQAEALWRQDPDPTIGIDMWGAHASWALDLL